MSPYSVASTSIALSNSLGLRGLGFVNLQPMNCVELPADSGLEGSLRDVPVRMGRSGLPNQDELARLLSGRAESLYLHQAFEPPYLTYTVVIDEGQIESTPSLSVVADSMKLKKGLEGPALTVGNLTGTEPYPVIKPARLEQVEPEGLWAGDCVQSMLEAYACLLGEDPQASTIIYKALSALRTPECAKMLMDKAKKLRKKPRLLGACRQPGSFTPAALRQPSSCVGIVSNSLFGFLDASGAKGVCPE